MMPQVMKMTGEVDEDDVTMTRGGEELRVCDGLGEGDLPQAKEGVRWTH